MCERAEGAGRGDGMKMPAGQAGLAAKAAKLAAWRVWLSGAARLRVA